MAKRMKVARTMVGAVDSALFQNWNGKHPRGSDGRFIPARPHQQMILTGAAGMLAGFVANAAFRRR